MPVPKRKRSRSRKNKRNANKGLGFRSFTHCKNCQEALAPHSACKACGHYKGEKVLMAKSERAVKREKVRKVRESRRAVEQVAKQEASAPVQEPEEGK